MTLGAVASTRTTKQLNPMMKFDRDGFILVGLCVSFMMDLARKIRFLNRRI